MHAGSPQHTSMGRSVRLRESMPSLSMMVWEVGCQPAWSGTRKVASFLACFCSMMRTPLGRCAVDEREASFLACCCSPRAWWLSARQSHALLLHHKGVCVAAPAGEPYPGLGVVAFCAPASQERQARPPARCNIMLCLRQGRCACLEPHGSRGDCAGSMHCWGAGADPTMAPCCDCSGQGR